MKSRTDNSFDLDKYTRYIGLKGFVPNQLSLDALSTLVEHHLCHFNYQNKLLYQAGKQPTIERKVPSLDKNDLLEWMIASKGGYCFQQLELIYAALTSIGFQVDRHLAKISMQPCSDSIDTSFDQLIPTHELLIVHLDSKDYIVDVGIANLSLRQPLELKEGEQKIDDDEYRLTKVNDKYRIDTKRSPGNEWVCLYQFSSFPVNGEAIVNAHQNLYVTAKKIPIRDEMLYFAKTDTEKRKFAVWFDSGKGIFKSTKKNVTEEKIDRFASLEETEAFAIKKFGLGS